MLILFRHVSEKLRRACRHKKADLPYSLLGLVLPLIPYGGVYAIKRSLYGYQFLLFYLIRGTNSAEKSSKYVFVRSFENTLAKLHKNLQSTTYLYEKVLNFM